MSKAYFLTREAASLMDDIIRQLKADAGLYLIYGEDGVGKTRMLDELARSRLSDCKIRWIDLQAGGESDGALVDSSELIEKTFIKANPGDVIVVDHFESALKKSRHQLFLCWSTEGIDKQLSLIVASNSEYFNELRQMAQQYQIRVQSFQQMPFSGDESEAFLGFYLFPDRPAGKLKVPAMLRNQLAMAQGNAARLIEIAERAGDQISLKTAGDSESIRQGSRVIAAVLAAVVVVAGIGWYFLDRADHREALPSGADSSMAVDSMSSPQSMAQAASDVAVEIDESVSGVAETESPVETQPGAVATELTEMAETPVEIRVDVNANEAEDTRAEAGELAETGAAEIAGESLGGESDPAPEMADTAAAELAVASEPVLSATEEFISQATSDEARSDSPASDPVAAVSETSPVTESPTVESAAPAQPASDAQRLQRDLQASLDWLSTRDDGIGTLQILLLSQSRFDSRAYYEHIDRLTSQGIDGSQLRILPTNTGNREVFSVVYGEYTSRSAAADARPGLPEVLRKDSPIVRSVGGLKEEIRRLDAQN